MSFEPGRMSSQYEIKRITKEDISSVYKICINNPLYYEHMKTKPTYENLMETLTQLPPNTTIEDKNFVGFYEENQLIAILDIIAGYPDSKTAYIGWFMIKKELQGSGIGSKIISEVISYLAEKEFQYVQLGYIRGNEQSERFWRKNMFCPIGREKETAEYTIVVMKREVRV